MVYLQRFVILRTSLISGVSHGGRFGLIGGFCHSACQNQLGGPAAKVVSPNQLVPDVLQISVVVEHSSVLLHDFVDLLKVFCSIVGPFFQQESGLRVPLEPLSLSLSLKSKHSAV